MIRFDPATPFPLFNEATSSRREEQLHSAAVDAWFGLRTDKVEQELAASGCRSRAPGAAGEKQQLWIGLATQDLLTPYTEIRRLLHRLSPKSGQTVIDLGAGYGRMAYVIRRHHPGVRFIGYEYVGERVREGRLCLARLKDTLSSLEHVDLAAPDFMPSVADIYFIYDYGTPKAIEKTLYDLRKIARLRPITVIGRGRKCREAIEQRHPWLSNAFPGESEGPATVYRSLMMDVEDHHEKNSSLAPSAV